MRVRPRWLFVLAVAALGGPGFALAAADIDQFYRVDDRVAIGAQPTPEQVTALSTEGFHAIINLREESEFDDQPQARAAADAGMLFLRDPVSRQMPTDESVEKFLSLTDEQRVYPVFIYCGSGNRAAALWMIRRVLRDGWALADAEAEADRAGLKTADMREFALGYIRRHKGGG